MISRLLKNWGGPAFFLLISLVPLLLGVGYAMLYSLGLTGVLSEGFTLAHWASLLSKSSFWLTMGFSFYVALVTIVLAGMVATALVLRDPQRFRQPTPSFLMYMPLAIPAIVMAFFIFQLLSKGGWLSRLSYQLGLINDLLAFPDWVNDNYGIGIIVSHLLMATPFFVLFLTNIYENEQIASYRQLAYTMGASRRQARWRIELPMLLRPAAPTLFLYFLFVMGSYEIPLLLGSQSVQMVSVLTIHKMQRFNLENIPQAYVTSVVYTMIVVLLIVLMAWLSPKKQTS